MADDPSWTPRQDMSLLCRVCANQHDYLIPIFEGEGLDHDMPNKMDKHLPIKVRENDKLPTQMCYQCASTIIAWSELVTNCLEADKKLSRMLKVNENKADTSAIADEDASSDHYEDAYDDVGGGGDDDNDDEDFEKEIKQLISDAGVKIVVPKAAKAKTTRASTRKRKSEAVPVKKENKKSKPDTSVSKSSTALIKPKEEVTSGEDRCVLWSCCICSGNFGSPADLGVHVDLHKNSRSKLGDDQHCFKCKKSFQSHRITKVARNAGVEGKFICWYCNQGLQDKRQLEIHIKVEHGEIVYGEAEWYGCQSCCKLYSRPQDISKHMRSVHDAGVEANDYIVDAIDNITIACNLCGKTNLLLNQCKTHISPKENISVSCEFCEVVFDDKRLLESHITIHHCNGDPNMKCYLCLTCCDQLHVGKAQFQDHMLQMHEDTPVNVENYIIEELNELLVRCKSCSKSCLLFSGFCAVHDANITIDNCNSHSENHECGVCHVNFVDCQMLWKHKFSEHESRTWHCNLCNIIVNSPRGLMSHWSLKHQSATNTIDCLHCGTVLEHVESLKEHIRQFHSTNKPFSCDLCAKTFSLEKTLDAHRRIRHGHTVSDTNVNLKMSCSITLDNGQVKFKCPQCDCEMGRFSSLKEHLTSVHSKAKEFICVVCGATYALQKRLREHCMRKHTVFIKTVLSEDETKTLLNNDPLTYVETTARGETKLVKSEYEVLDEHGHVRYKCQSCSEIFSEYSGLMQHIQSLDCTAQTNLVCTYCEKTFLDKIKLRQHYRKVHGVMMRTNEVADLKNQYGITIDGVTSYKCPHCNSMFRKFFYLRKHLKIHSGVRPFACHVCNKSFILREHLIRHSNIHTGKGYQCNICGRVMSDRTNLKVHMRNHTGEKKYICDVCGKGFAQWSSHYYHMFTHSNTRDFSCTVCEKKFQTPAGLREHKRVHATTDENHICETCGNSYSSRKNLLSHVKIHATERDFKCEFCSAAFVRRKYLVQHYKTHRMTKLKSK